MDTATQHDSEENRFEFYGYTVTETEFARRVESQEDLLIWFREAHHIVVNWLREDRRLKGYREMFPAILQLPKVQEFLLRFAQLAADETFKELKVVDVWNFLLLCMETHQAIINFYFSNA